MAKICNPLTTMLAASKTTETPTTVTTDDVVTELTTLKKTALVDDQTSNADTFASENTSGVKKPKAPRGKIKMEKMEKENNLLVTFSKRKSSLVKKANELCTMCGVQCALVVFSPASKVFSFGHPSVDQLADRYLSGNPNPIFAQQDVDADVANTEDLIAELRDLEAVFEAAKKHRKEMEERRVARMPSCWWERPVQELNGHEIETLKRAMVDLKSQVFDMAKLRFMPLAPSPSSSPSPSLRLGLNYPSLHGDETSTALSFGPFQRWNNNNHGPDEAGPSCHASKGWVKGSHSGSLDD